MLLLCVMSGFSNFQSLLTAVDEAGSARRRDGRDQHTAQQCRTAADLWVPHQRQPRIGMVVSEANATKTHIHALCSG
jgi:hypothetical protein